MNHLRRGDNRGVTGDLDRAAPAALGHARQVATDKPHGRKHIHVEVGAPLLVGDLHRRNRPEDAEVVHQDVDVGQLTQQLGSSLLRRDVGGNTQDVELAQFGDGLIDAGRRTTVDGDAGTATCKLLGDGQPDALRRARDECGLSGQFDVHKAVLPPIRANYSRLRSSRLRILPVGLRGNSSRNTTSRGTL